MAEQVGTPEQNAINAVSWLFFFFFFSNLDVILKEIMKEGEKTLFQLCEERGPFWCSAKWMNLPPKLILWSMMLICLMEWMLFIHITLHLSEIHGLSFKNADKTTFLVNLVFF